jgi:hypothetical protein
MMMIKMTAINTIVATTLPMIMEVDCGCIDEGEGDTNRESVLNDDNFPVNEVIKIIGVDSIIEDMCAVS